MRRQVPKPSQRGVSLVEILVVIGILGVLVSVAVPALRGARERARETVSLVNARTIATLIDDHARTHDAYPVTRHDKVHSEYPGGPPAWSIDDPILARWVTAWSWWDAMEDEGFDARPHWEAFFSPGSPTRHHRSQSHYMFSTSFVAAPSLWRPGHDPGDTSVLRRVRPTEVRFPSGKVMVWDWVQAYRDEPYDLRFDRTPMAFADTHAEIKDRAQAAEPVPNVLSQRGFGHEEKFHNTPEGVEGYDY